MSSDKRFVTNSCDPKNDKLLKSEPQSRTSMASSSFVHGTTASLDANEDQSSNLIQKQQHHQQVQPDPTDIQHLTEQGFLAVPGDMIRMQSPSRVQMTTQQGQFMQPGQSVGNNIPTQFQLPAQPRAQHISQMQTFNQQQMHSSPARGGSSMPSPPVLNIPTPAQSTAMQQHIIGLLPSSGMPRSSPVSHLGTSDQVIRQSNQTASAKQQRILQRHSDHGGPRDAPQPDEPTPKKGRMMTKPDGVKGNEGHVKSQERRYVDQKHDNFKMQLRKEKEKPHVKNTPEADNTVAVIYEQESQKVLVTFNGISKHNLPRVVSAAEPFKVVGAEGVDFRKYHHDSCEVTYENRTYHVCVFLDVEWTPPTESAMA